MIDIVRCNLKTIERNIISYDAIQNHFVEHET